MRAPRGPSRRAWSGPSSASGCRDGYKPTENGVYEMIETYLRPVMVKWASFGTADTEPRCHAFAAIERAVRVLTGEGV